MNVIINEKQFKNIINLLEAEQDVSEVLGVPDNIYETGVEVVNGIVDQLEELKNQYEIKVNDALKIGGHFQTRGSVDGPFDISDYKINSAIFDLKVKIYDIDKPKMVYGAISIPNQKIIDKDNNLSLTHVKHTMGDTINIELFIIIPKVKQDGSLFDLSGVIEFFKNEKDDFITTITHELMHGYDAKKTPTAKIKDTSFYNAPMSITPNIPTIDKFLFNMYFIENTENTVRPSEMYAYMRNGKISQEGFKEFIEKNNIFVKLKQIINYNYADFLSGISNEESEIDKYMEKVGKIHVWESMTTNQKIKYILDKLFISFKESVVDDYSQKIGTRQSFFNFVFETPKTPEEEKAIENIKKEFSKYKSGDDFFESQMKIMKIKAYDLYKKLSKLYALATPSSNKKPNEFFKKN